MSNRRKSALILILFTISILYITQITYVAADNDPLLAIKEGDSYYFVVEVLDQEKYVEATGSSPNSFAGRNSKIEIEYIYKGKDSWQIEYEVVYYLDDSDKEPFEESMIILDDPSNETGDDVLVGFIPLLALKYLKDWDVPDDYSVEDLVVTFEDEVSGKDYEEIWTYQDNGIMSSHVINYDGEEIYRFILNPNLVPFGLYFLGFMAIAIIGLIIITIKKYRGCQR